MNGEAAIVTYTRRRTSPSCNTSSPPAATTHASARKIQRLPAPIRRSGRPQLDPPHRPSQLNAAATRCRGVVDVRPLCDTFMKVSQSGGGGHIFVGVCGVLYLGFILNVALFDNGLCGAFAGASAGAAAAATGAGAERAVGEKQYCKTEEVLFHSTHSQAHASSAALHVFLVNNGNNLSRRGCQPIRRHVFVL